MELYEHFHVNFFFKAVRIHQKCLYNMYWFIQSTWCVLWVLITEIVCYIAMLSKLNVCNFTENDFSLLNIIKEQLISFLRFILKFLFV